MRPLEMSTPRMNEYKITIYIKSNSNYADSEVWEFGWISIQQADSAKLALELVRESLKDTRAIRHEIRDIAKL